MPCGKTVEAYVTGLCLARADLPRKGWNVLAEDTEELSLTTEPAAAAAGGVMDENAYSALVFVVVGRNFPHFDFSSRDLSCLQFLLIDTHLLFSTRLERNHWFEYAAGALLVFSAILQQL